MYWNGLVQWVADNFWQMEFLAALAGLCLVAVSIWLVIRFPRRKGGH